MYVVPTFVALSLVLGALLAYELVRYLRGRRHRCPHNRLLAVCEECFRAHMSHKAAMQAAWLDWTLQHYKVRGSYSVAMLIDAVHEKERLYEIQVRALQEDVKTLKRLNRRLREGRSVGTQA